MQRQQIGRIAGIILALLTALLAVASLWAQGGLVEIRAYLIAMIEERRRRPRQDLMSKFVAVESAGERLSDCHLGRLVDHGVGCALE